MRSPVSPPIPAEYAAALRAVDLHGYFVNHGEAVFLEGHGPATVAVGDRDYEPFDRMVAGLRPERGDTVALEGFGFDPNKDPFDGLRNLSRNSPYLPTLAATPNQAALSQLAQRGRKLQILGPFRYVQARAAAQGVPTRYAGIEATEWRQAPRLGSLAFGPRRQEKARRDHAIVMGLGKIAAEMTAQGQQERPKLVLGAGLLHAKSVARILRDNNIPITVHAPNRLAACARIAANILINLTIVALSRQESELLDTGSRPAAGRFDEVEATLVK